MPGNGFQRRSGKEGSATLRMTTKRPGSSGPTSYYGKGLEEHSREQLDAGQQSTRHLNCDSYDISSATVESSGDWVVTRFWLALGHFQDFS